LKEYEYIGISPEQLPKLKFLLEWKAQLDKMVVILNRHVPNKRVQSIKYFVPLIPT
jgi:hypothetical protein